MATRTWNSSSSTDMNDGANYTGSGALLTSDDLVFDNTSVINATATASLDVNSVTVASTYSGNWSVSGRNLTIRGNTGISFDGTGTYNYGNMFLFKGSAPAFHVGSGVGVTNGLSCRLRVGEAGDTVALTTDFDKNFGFRSVECVAGCSVVLDGSATQITFYGNASLVPLVGYDGSTFTFNVPCVIGITSSIAQSLMSLTGTVTIDGDTLIIFMAGATGTAATGYIPAFTYSGTSSISFQLSGTANTLGVIELTGNINVSTLRIYAATTGASSPTFTFNQGGYSITCDTLRYGVNYATCTVELNFDGVIDVDNDVNDVIYNTGTCTVNLDGSTWDVQNNYTALSGATYNVGSCSITISGASTLTSNGKIWTNDLTINASGLSVSTADDLSIGGDLTVTAGTLNISGDDVTIGGDLTIASGSTFTTDASSTLTFSGNSTITTGGKTLPQTTINGNTAINTGCTIGRLIYGTDGKTVTLQQGQTFTISNLTASNWNGTSGSLNAMVSSSAGTRATVALPGNVTLEYVKLKDINATGYVITANDGTSETQGNNRGCVFSNVVTLDISSGPESGGTTVAAADTGNCFGGSFSVTVGGTGADSETVVDTRHGSFSTPAGTGVVNVVITTSDDETITLTNAFTYTSGGAGAKVVPFGIDGIQIYRG